MSTEIIILLAFRPDGKRVRREVWLEVDGTEISEASGLPAPLLLPTRLPQEWLPRGAAIGRSDVSQKARNRLGRPGDVLADGTVVGPRPLEGEQPLFDVGGNGHLDGR